MPRTNALISDFSAGEIAKWFYGKTTNPIYYKGASQMVNFQPRPQGGFRKTPGTIFAGHTGGPDAVAQILAIKVSTTVSYILEFTNNLVRFWKFTGGALTYLAGKDIVTTITTAETSQLQVAWMFPDLFIAHQNHPPSRIRWSTGDNFAKQDIVFVKTSYTFTAVFATGSPTLTTIAGVTGQTSTNLPLPSVNPPQTGVWVLTDTTTPGNIPANTYLTQVYPSATPSLAIAAASATMNNNSAGASAGAPGDTLVLTQANLPFQSSGNYPRCVAVAYQRVFFANSINNPQTVWASIIGVWDSTDSTGAAGKMNVNLFEATTYPQQQMLVDTAGNPTANPPAFYNLQQTQNAIADSDGIQVTLTETQSEILWIAGSHDLILGAADGEVVIPANNAGLIGISPNSISDNMVSKAGSAAVQGEVFVIGVVFVQLGGQNVFETVWQGANNPYNPPNPLSWYSNHLFIGNQITQWDFAQAPEPIGYFGRADGTLACLHYYPAQGIMAWWQLKTRAGDVINSVAVQTGPNGDVLFLSVTRGAFNYIEFLSSPDWTDVRLSNYMHASTQATGVNLTTIAVDTSFNGVTMGVVADGKYLGTAAPVGGVLTLPGGVKANNITVGLLPATPTVKTLPISPDGQYGPGIADIRNIDHVGLVLYNTLDIQVGTDGSTLQSCPEVTAATGANPTPYTGEPEPVPIEVTNTRQPVFVIQSSAPLPCEVTAIVPEVTH